MKTVREMSRITGTLVVITVAALIMRHYYLAFDYDCFDTIKAFMQTRVVIGGVHSWLMDLALWVSVMIGVANAVLDGKYGPGIISELWVPVFMMGGWALLLIPHIGLGNIRLFWFICYILAAVGTWFSTRKITGFCLKNSNLPALLKKSAAGLGIKTDRVDFTVAMVLTTASYILLGALVAGGVIFGVRNWELITGPDDIGPVLSSIRYEAAVEYMGEGEYEKAMAEFRELEGYKDSRTMAIKCEDLLYRPTYLEAMRLMDQSEYDEARSIFWSIYDYRDSAEKIEQCDELQYAPQYDEAVALMGGGYYEEALEILEMLRGTGYRDAFEEIEQCRSALRLSLSGTWRGDAGSSLTLREDLTCGYVDGGGPTGDGIWDVVDGRLVVQTDALSYELYGYLEDGYATTSILIQADSSDWRDETFTRG